MTKKKLNFNLPEKYVLENGFEIPKQTYVICFSDGTNMIIPHVTFKQILEQFENNQDIMLFTKENSMINLNQIVKIVPGKTFFDKDINELKDYTNLKPF